MHIMNMYIPVVQYILKDSFTCRFHLLCMKMDKTEIQCNCNGTWQYSLHFYFKSWISNRLPQKSLEWQKFLNFYDSNTITKIFTFTHIIFSSVFHYWVGFCSSWALSIAIRRKTSKLLHTRIFVPIHWTDLYTELWI